MNEYIDQLAQLVRPGLNLFDATLRYLLETFMENPQKNYFICAAIIGLPMALISVVSYWLEETLDDYWYLWPLKLARNFVHPGSFLLLPDCEHEPRSNYRMNYEGLIRDWLDDFESPGAIPFYLIITSLFWPARLFFSLMVYTIIGSLCTIMIVIGSPFLLLRGLCYLICWPFQKKDRW